ncbi:type I-B CRISPR-associated protein Cas7/Cst2/DevR [Clostridium perfringens]|uniref:CRISPR-associated regulatory protein, DevR family n=1 Tax=Clostridium perfringens (strain SM101 / Type A) TaxID=289380 RepID=Q0SUG3_CLOPS|nr:type I-B CRISPR-associated protein Cas7/Cst2/DevR [Clostridium perfringens]ABG86299.1 CRISPR-associated regulatory protein, DevR family [Clostridium perfringens SM101]EJT5917273.1 type I-B CRISPR-associated protein Cas7/Cst2/DevR [Clostridium perfringens]EJT5925787.1 type I-B CRISPR-associated protein Cas7/Cst2/DevR [Clostridium perfringens]EJT6135988.1 type I-B CRISPR-associated protein Cas7/Cst2/DevR [Clostridium perfringens]MBI6013134.1 type I-B CRISPR-associated protein Cas7/Cst2/DevR [
MKGKSVTLTVIANMTSNYGEGLGNISSVQKVFKNGKIYSARSKESLKNAIMVQSGLYDDLETSLYKNVNQKLVSKDLNVTNCRALEGGYMNTSDNTYVRKSSFYLTDAVSCDEFINEYRFHNNLYLATNYAKHNNINLQGNAQKAGLMPYQYEFDKSLKIYSLTIDLDMIGRDENFDSEEASAEEKAYRVNAILDAVKNLSLIVKGNLDNAEPIFVVGGIINRKTHYFENLVKVKNDKLEITEELKDRINNGCYVGFLEGGNFENEVQIKEELKPLTVSKFFSNLEEEVRKYYGV